MTRWRRGQVTAFIILGLLVAGAVFMLLYFKSSAAEKKMETEIQKSGTLSTDTIANYVTVCIKSVGEEALFDNGKTGGYFYLPAASTKDLQENVPLYAFDNQPMIPTMEEMSRQLGIAVDALLGICLHDFEAFKEQGYAVSAEKPVSAVTPAKDGFLIKTTIPITAVRDDATQTLSEFSAMIQAPQWHETFAVAQAVPSAVVGPSVCLTCFEDVAEKNSIYVGILPLRNDQYLFDLKHDGYVREAKPFHFRFAVKFDPRAQPPEEQESETGLGEGVEGEGEPSEFEE